LYNNLYQPKRVGLSLVWVLIAIGYDQEALSHRDYLHHLKAPIARTRAIWYQRVHSKRRALRLQALGQSLAKPLAQTRLSPQASQVQCLRQPSAMVLQLSDVLF
jgi:hypothetical protein